MQNYNNSTIKRALRWLLMIIAIFIMLFNSVFPIPDTWNKTTFSAICIFASTIYLMIFEDVKWPVLLCVIAIPISGIYTMQKSMQLSFGSELFLFIVSNTMMLGAIKRTGLFHRFAKWAFSLKITKKNPLIFISCIYISEFIVGIFTGAVVAIILFINITEGIFKEVGIKKGSRTGRYIVLGETFVAGISFGFSPFHPQALASIKNFNSIETISYVNYILNSFIPCLCLLMVVITILIVVKVDLSMFSNRKYINEKKEPLSRREIFGLLTFICVLILWLLPDAVEQLSSYGVVFPVFCAIILFAIIPVEGKPMINIIDSLKEDASWQAAFPLAAAALLGSLFSDKDIGITPLLSETLGTTLTGLDPMLLLIIIGLLACMLSNFCSDTVSAVVASTITVALYHSGCFYELNPTLLCVIIGNCTSYAYATAPASPYSAYISGSGWLNSKFQFVFGIGFAILSSLIFILMASIINLVIM